MGTDAFLATGEQVRTLEPFVQRNMTGLENRADCDREFTLAWAAAA